MHLRPSLSTASTAFLIACLLAVAAISYAPGLRGGFLFDDYANLPSLGATGPISNLSALERYLTSGNADPTGRPLSVASFLVDARNWPAQPYPFKRTSLLLHLLNGALLFAVLTQLGKLQHWPRRKTLIAATIGTMGWLVNPLFVSTVLYVVQREAMLPATFILAGILCSCVARERLAEARIRSGYLWLIFGVGTCTALAFLSKANGILLPLLVLVVHATLPRDDAATARRIGLPFLTVLGPVAFALVGWLAWTAIRAIGGAPIPHRGWTISQRLLTEPTILADYLSRLFLLRPIDGSLLHDDYPVASSLFSPWYTALFIAAWGAALAGAWIYRRRFPALAAATVFFVAAHLIESGPIGLELYFEHRNYIPAMLLFWPVGAGLAMLRSRTVVTIATLGLACVLSGLTFAQATLWGDPLRQAQAWATAHPESPRAVSYAASSESNAGHTEAAIRRLDAAAPAFTAEPQVWLNLVMLRCEAGVLTESTIQGAATSLRTASREPGSLLAYWFDRAIPLAHRGACEGLTRAALEGLLDAANANPRINTLPGRRQDLLHLRGSIALAWNEPDMALADFDNALAEQPEPQVALAQAASLGRAGFPALGLRHLSTWRSLPPPPALTWHDGMPWLHARVLSHQGYWDTEFRRLEAALRSDAERRAR